MSHTFEGLTVEKVDDLPKLTRELDVLVLSAGFEDRAFYVLPEGDFPSTAHCVLVRYVNNIPGNNEVFEKFHAAASEKFRRENMHVVELRHGHQRQFEDAVRAVVGQMSLSLRTFGVDVSGLPSFAICVILKALRDYRPEEPQRLFYTAATSYNPSYAEYEELIRENGGDIELIPRSMALEMDENLILDSFSGYRSQSAKCCLAVFAGHEVHRSNGVIEAVNPSLLLLLYGSPGDSALAWRLDLSRRLHNKFERGRRTAVETVSTLQLREATDILAQYYNYLIDDYDLVVAPISSKMHAVAAYLFWERYPEIQLTFPIPIGYDPNLSPKGVACAYAVDLAPRRSFFQAERSQPTP